MIEQQENEDRTAYLIRVAYTFIQENELVANQEIEYDETSCDAYCLADELMTEYENYIFDKKE